MPEKQDLESEQEKKSDVVPQEQYNQVLKDKENLNRGIAKIRESDTQKSQRIKELEEENAKLSQGSETPEGTDDERLQALLEKQGYVKKEELEKRDRDQAVKTADSIKQRAINSFLEANPEFNETENWTRLNNEFIQNYKDQPTEKDWTRILNKIKKDLTGDNSKEQGKVEAKIEAKDNSRLTIGGGSQPSAKTDTKVESFIKNRPNLSASKEALKAQQAEIDKLYPEKKE